MNVPDSWVKSVCEKLGIPEPQPEIGAFWDGEFDFHKGICISETGDGDGDYGFREKDGTSWEHFKPLSSETIAMIKKDLGIE